MAPSRNSPSPPSSSSAISDMDSSPPRRIEPLPEGVAKPNREEIFSFPHTKRVGSYILGRTLGEGAFAKVKEGRHLLTGEKVAVKVIDKKKAKEDPYVAKNMRREAKLMMMVLHPNVLKLLEVVETDNSYYLVTEMAEGGDLMDRICRKQYLAEDEVRKYIRQIVSAVDYLHRANVVHRDLKIENLLLDANLNIKIIDFGLSNTLEPTRSMATLSPVDKHCRTQCGSPAYAAPELLGHSQYGPSVDIWSIGVNMYAMLTGSLPYTVEPFNITELHAKMISNRMNPLPEHITPSAECRDLLCKLLNPNPEQRISLADVFKHPWLNQATDSPYVQTPHPNFPSDADLDDRILHHMTAHLNCSLNDIIKAMTSNRAVHASACYKLLEKRLERYYAAHPEKRPSHQPAVPAPAPPVARQVSSESSRGGQRRKSSPAVPTAHVSQMEQPRPRPHSNRASPTRVHTLERPMEAGAARRRRSVSDGAGTAAIGKSVHVSKDAIKGLKTPKGEAEDQCMPLNEGDGGLVAPVKRSGRRWSVSGGESPMRRMHASPRVVTTPNVSQPRRAPTRQYRHSRTAPASPSSPVTPNSVSGEVMEPLVNPIKLEEEVCKAFSRPQQRQQPRDQHEQTWLMADGELPGIQSSGGHSNATTPTTRFDRDTEEMLWQSRRDGPTSGHRRAKSGPASKIGRAHSFRDELLMGTDAGPDHPGRRKVKQNTLFTQTNADSIDVFAQANRQTTVTAVNGKRRASTENAKPPSTLPAIPRGITSAGRSRPQPKSTIPPITGDSGPRPHTTIANGRRVSAGSKFVTAIDGLSDLPADAVIHEVIRVLRNLRVEDWEPKGYDTILCTWFETRFEITVIEDAGVCQLSFERLASMGSQLRFRDACDQIIGALRVNVAV